MTVLTVITQPILAAAATMYDGGDVCPMWEAFAAFGLGADAVSGGPNGTTPTDGFAVPAACSADLPFLDGPLPDIVDLGANHTRYADEDGGVGR